MTITSKSLHFSDQFTLSCGTITLDPVKRKLLLIRTNETGEVLFPKGRKNLDETLSDAALRETHEETGFRATLFPLHFPTLATAAFEMADRQPSAVTEPFAVSQRHDEDNKVKIIFWFMAKGDSSAKPDSGTLQEGEDFDSIWAQFDVAVKSLTFDDDKQIAQKAIDIFSSNVARAAIVAQLF